MKSAIVPKVFFQHPKKAPNYFCLFFASIAENAQKIHFELFLSEGFLDQIYKSENLLVLLFNQGGNHFEQNVLNIIVNKKKAFSFFSRFHFVFLWIYSDKVLFFRTEYRL